MTVGDWLRTRTPVAPDRLMERVVDVLGDRADHDVSRASELCLDAADVLLRDLLARDQVGRASALDLLTVDALVTYAFEAASESPAGLPEHASEAMRRLAATARA